MQYNITRIFKKLNRKIIEKYDPWTPFDEEDFAEGELVHTEQPVYDECVIEKPVDVVKPKKKKKKKKIKPSVQVLPEPEIEDGPVDFNTFNYDEMNDVGMNILSNLQKENEELNCLIEEIEPRVSAVEQRMQVEDEKLKVLNEMRSTLNTMQYRQFKDLSNRSGG